MTGVRPQSDDPLSGHAPIADSTVWAGHSRGATSDDICKVDNPADPGCPDPAPKIRVTLSASDQALAN